MPYLGKPVRPFVPFKWFERDEMALAWHYALENSQSVATELDVLLAILDGPSETNSWLKRYPLQDHHAQVRALVERWRHKKPGNDKSPTPD
jgi:hypothetical protein